MSSKVSKSASTSNIPTLSRLTIHCASQSSMDGMALRSSSSPSSADTMSSASPRSVTLFAYVDNSSTSPIKQEPTSPPLIEELGNDDDDTPISPTDVKREEDDPLQGNEETHALAPIKRGRGRPRKIPPPVPVMAAKPNKGRSKTGCMTCRRRKKKCDELKPECYNCTKNGLVCEGYPAKKVWQSGKGRSNSMTMLKSEYKRDVPNLPFLIDGVETELDRRLLDHFVQELSKKLTLFNEDQNPFTDHFIPLAMHHRGLMHAILALSGSHLLQTEPAIEETQTNHFNRALNHFQVEIEAANKGDTSVHDSLVATSLVLCVDIICRGQINGEYRQYLNFVGSSIIFHRSENHDLARFNFEFFVYHHVLNCVTNLDRALRFNAEEYCLPSFIRQPETGIFVGVLDGLFSHISRITALRDQIRFRKDSGMHPVIDFEMLNRSLLLDEEIRNWTPSHPPGTHRFTAAQLYQQCTWLYLFRTIQRSQPCEKIDNAVKEGLQLLRSLPETEGVMSILLMPLFILGCSAFNPDHRPEIEQGFDKLMRYSGLQNIARSKEVVHKVWALMDQGDETSWDWETILKNMGYDFLVT